MKSEFAESGAQRTYRRAEHAGSVPLLRRWGFRSAALSQRLRTGLTYDAPSGAKEKEQVSHVKMRRLGMTHRETRNQKSEGRNEKLETSNQKLEGRNWETRNREAGN